MTLGLVGWIRTRLARRIATWSLCLSLALMAIIGGVSLITIRSLLLSDIQRQAENAAALAGVRLELTLNDFLEEAVELAGSPLVAAALAAPRGRTTFLEPFLSGRRAGGVLPVTFTLADADGRTLATAGTEGKPAPAWTPWLAKVAELGRPMIRLGDRADGSPVTLEAAHPVPGPASDRARGVLVGTLQLSALFSGALDLPAPDTAIELRGPDGATLARATTIPPGGRLLTVAKPLRLKGLSAAESPTVVVGLDHWAALAPLRRFSAIFAGLALLVAVVVFALATWMGRRLSRPIAGLAEAAARISAGAPLDTVRAALPPPNGGGDEVGRLGGAFGAMLDRLGELYAGLEDEVDSRARALGETQAVLERVLASAQDVICSFTPDLSRILYVNPAIERVTGWPVEIFLSDPALLRSMIDPADRDGWDAALAGLRPDTPSTQAVFRIGRLGGGRRWLHGRYLLIGGADGAAPVVDGIVTDITERRVAELAVATSEARLRAIFETVADGIITIDGYGFIESVNPAACRLFGYEADEMIGRNVSMLMPDPERSIHDDAVGRCRDSGGRFFGVSRELIGLRSDGSPVPIELAIGELHAHDSPHFLGVIRDVTERRRAQDALRAAKEQAEAASTAKAEFLAMMSHEIRTPLNGVLGMIELLEDGELPDEQRHYVATARRSGEALLDILNDILDFSKMEAGRLDLSFGPMEPARLATEVVETLGARAREKAISLDVVVEPGAPERILGDQGRIRQVLLNLVSNAIKFTDRGGVRVVLAPDREAGPPRLRVSVADSGVGIPPEALGRLFSRFSQVDSSISRRYGGTGLGLAIAKKLVELMNGEIGVASGLGVGSTFWFALPAEPPAEADSAAAIEDSMETPHETRPGARILLVEDSETNRLVATTLLRKAGYEVETADNGRAAVEAVTGGGFDLVLMDVAMPELNGFQATQAIRALPGPESMIAIVAMTANAMAGDRARCLEAGMDDYLPKPLPKAQLLAMVERYLGRPPEAAKPPAERSQGARHVARSLGSLAEDIPVEVLGTIIETFIEDARVRLARMAESMGDREVLEAEAHPVKSSSRTFGLEALAGRAEHIESACRAGDTPRAATLTAELLAVSEDAFTTLRAELKLLLDAAS